jgi:hypothetical protein
MTGDETGDREGRATALESLTGVYRRQGRYDKTMGCLHQEMGRRRRAARRSLS